MTENQPIIFKNTFLHIEGNDYPIMYLYKEQLFVQVGMNVKVVPAAAIDVDDVLKEKDSWEYAEDPLVLEMLELTLEAKGGGSDQVH